MYQRTTIYIATRFIVVAYTYSVRVAFKVGEVQRAGITVDVGVGVVAAKKDYHCTHDRPASKSGRSKKISVQSPGVGDDPAVTVTVTWGWRCSFWW